MAEEILIPHQIADKHSCCSVHLKPLLERINTLEHRLLIETQRRQNEYNELLHILLTIKRQKKEESSPSKNQQAIKPISKLIVANTIHNKKGKESYIANSQVKGSSKGKSAKKNSKPLRRSSQNMKKTELTAPTAQPVFNKKSSKDDSIAQTIQKHKDEINKLKELSNYLMEQLLMLFEKVKEIQAEDNHATSPKSFPTQQTITSIVFDAAQKQALVKNQHLSDEVLGVDEKIQKIQAMILSHNNALHEQHAKISEHQNMLAQLIALTRGLSNRIVEIPLYLNSPYDVSPSKP